MALWTVLLGAVLWWNFQRENRYASEQAAFNARMSFEKDVVFRRWVAKQGGVYVPPSKDTPPNPHLAQLKHRDLMTVDGKALTLVNPAYMTRQVHELQALPGDAFFKRADGIYLAANKSFCDAVGCALDEIAGKTDYDLFPRDVANRHRAEDRQLLEGGQPVLDEESSRMVGGVPRTVATRKVVLTNEAGQLVRLIGLGFDITDRKKAEREKMEMELQLHQAQKLESIGRMAAGIAHEINTPTQYIRDNVRFLQEAFTNLSTLLAEYEKLRRAAEQQSGLPEAVAQVNAAVQQADTEYLVAEVPKALEQSLEGVDRVSKIVHAMKQFSHPGWSEKSLVNINQTIESTLEVARNEWTFVAKLTLDLEPSLTPVWCLPAELNQAILNLVINAAHAIAEKVGDGSRGKGTLSVSTRRTGDWVEIRIRDTGAGIPQAIQNRMFEPFFTTKPVGKGTGQGLAIARSVIIDKHGGTISFESTEGIGTTFIIRLPIDPAAAPAVKHVPMRHAA